MLPLLTLFPHETHSSTKAITFQAHSHHIFGLGMLQDPLPWHVNLEL
jgi:hypothetical protein